MNRFKALLATLFFILTLSAQDLSKIDLSKLTPEQIEMYKKYMASKGNATPLAASSADSKTPDDRKIVVEEASADIPVTSSLNYFGSYLFSNQQLSFEPKLNIPTPSNYVLGAYDELIVDVSGLYEAYYKLKVSPEGSIRIPNVGPVKVSGRTVEEATRSIRSEVTKVYQGVSTGETKINVSLGNIRSIRITVIGDAVRPGTYTLPSLATAFNALYACGGPAESGSMRSVKVIRSGKQIATIDVYKYLTDGVIPNNVLLHDEDIIRIEPSRIRVQIQGTTKKTGIFEGIEGETLSDIIRYTGGFTDNAYTKLATVVRIADNQKKVIDVAEADYKKFRIQSGDEYTFSSNPDKFKNRIEITGSVNRPGTYSLETGLTVSQLINKAAGLKEDAFLNMAIISRKRENQIPENINFNLGDLIKGKIADITLQRDDKVEIKSLFEYREGYSVSISGEVKSPGNYALVENLTLMDLILKARGFTEAAASDSIELIRIIKDKNSLLNSNQKSIIKKFKIDKDLNMNSSDGKFILENGDQIVVRRISGFETIRMVRIDGEVLRPGDYNIKSKDEYISDVIKRAGGFTNYSYPSGAFLIRNPKLDNAQLRLNRFMSENAKSLIEKSSSNNIDADLLQKAGLKSMNNIDAIDSLQQKLNGADIIKNIENTEGIVGINLTNIMRNPRGKYDLKLEQGDVIYVPRELQTVRVMGAVYFPTYVRYDRNSTLKEYLNSAGGISSTALRSKIFVLHPNGTSSSTRNFLGIKCYPKVMPGSQILVPQKQIDIRQKMSTGESISIMTSVTSAAAIVYSIVSNAQKNTTNP